MKPKTKLSGFIQPMKQPMRNKQILVTGGAGFIGSHLTKRLIELGAEVSVVVKYKSLIDNIRLSRVWNDITVIEADLRNIDSLRQLQNRRYDLIFHLAAYNHVGDSFLHVNEALMSNAVATANLLEFAPEYGRFIYTSTSEVYGLQTAVPFHEELTPFPLSPYSIGKYTGELYSRMKRVQTGKPIVCLRPFNAFGPYQSERAIIPELIIKCLRGNPIETTAGKQTREFNYVENIIDGFIPASQTPSIFERIINIGSHQEIAICDLVKKIHSLTASKSDLRIGALEYRPTEIWRMCADTSSAQQVLDWTPKISFETGLQHTIEWYRTYLDVFYSRDSPLNQL
ncbi:NAD-dependent epimerase/dehydratase family protein [candidate division KSB3 bacterium]|uniref:NAD-dependent epimerase/dehydratase family protein n=1 Tax=candidate division KSB3 bacterium TaxID=2044937 RepID=A0A9D5JV36_9BACT|nr:NAD-dependent epimerase/dehydratase family protein [candidate division KSB3 bacterium]MBD3324221.1 NAD-dependent epimerase/dehydratase family protein [candidate division KSB3 bacterium]